MKDFDFCETIAYQHTGISKFQNILLKIRNINYFPDKILVVNKNDKLKFKKFNKFSNIFNVGKIIKTKKLKNWKSFNKKILVSLTTSHFENEKFIDLICDQNFINNKIYKFIIRFHPNANEKTRKLFKKKIDLFKLNYSISQKKSLDNDLSFCSTAIIGSGSSLIDCINKGVFPLIFKNAEIIDTPANLNQKIFKFIKNSKELNEFLNSYNKNLLKFNYKKNIIFSQNYFNNFNLRILEHSFKQRIN